MSLASSFDRKEHAMRSPEEEDTEKADPERIEEEHERDEDMLEEELDEDEESVVPQRGEIEHGEKSREGDAEEIDDRVAWRPEDEREVDEGDRRS
jgi:hypothetical protein